MQPPPRKTKHCLSLLKTVHSDQVSKLQHKHQHEIELLEDIRLFTKQRSSIEKEYAQSLCKLAQHFLSKGKFPIPPNIATEDGQEFKKNQGRTISEVWKTVLDETDRVGKIRLQASETYHQQISEPVKPIKTNKTTVAKKVFEQIKILQKELDQSLQDLVKSQKTYNEEEHITHDAVLKANEAESKVKNKSTGLFTSLAKLQQTSAKLNTRRDTCEVKSTAARNDYLLNLASSNVHLERYYVTELPELIKSLDGEMYDKVRDFFITLSKMEVDCCGLTQERFMKILTDSTMISRQFDHQCFLHNNLVFTDKVQYQFEAQENDPVKKVSPDHNATEQLNEEAKKCALKVAKENKHLQQIQNKLDHLKQAFTNSKNKSESGEEPSSPTSPGDTEVKIEELRLASRKAETAKRKAEARLLAMRDANIDIDEWLNKAQAQVDAEIDEEEVSQTKSSAGRSDSSSTVANTAPSGDQPDDGSKQAPSNGAAGGGSGADNTARNRPQSQSDSTNLPPNDSTYVNYQDDDYDENFAGGTQPDGSIGYVSLGQNVPLKAVAIYDFQANNADELDIKEGEAVDVIGEGDGDGWVQARNSGGKVGFVPQNYLQYSENASGHVEDQNEMNVDHETNGDVGSVGASAEYNSGGSVSGASAPASAGYSTGSVSGASAPPSAGYDSVAPSSAGYDTMGSAGEKTSNYSTTDYEVQQAIRPTDINTGDGALWARAQYDFEATSEEELSFQEGQLIRIIQKDENGVDDGWWKGEIKGKVGVFPSLVVEEISQEDLSAHDMTSPNRPGPPAFTPPEPGPPPPSLAVTQPTPSDEAGPTVNNMKSNDAPPEPPVADDTPSDDAGDTEPPLPPPPPELVAPDEQNEDAASTAVNYNSDSVDTCSTMNGDMEGEAKAPTAPAETPSDQVVVAEVYNAPTGGDDSKDKSVSADDQVHLSDEENGESLL